MACEGAKSQLHSFLTSTLTGSECSASGFGHFTPRRTRGNSPKSMKEKADWDPEISGHFLGRRNNSVPHQDQPSIRRAF